MSDGEEASRDRVNVESTQFEISGWMHKRLTELPASYTAALGFVVWAAQKATLQEATTTGE